MKQEEQFKQAMSRFATGVCVVTFKAPQTKQTEGVTISAFSSLSLQPAKILFCLGNKGRTSSLFQQVDRFTVNLLSRQQKSLAYQFAGPDRENLSDVLTTLEGVPAIKETLANVVCKKASVYPEGDHDIVVGEVQSIVINRDNTHPLLYFKSTIIEDFYYGEE